MTPRERLLQAWNFSDADPVPYTVWYDHPTMEKLNAHYGGTKWQEKIKNHILRATVDWEPAFEIGDGAYRDVYGTRWQKGDPAHVTEPALSSPSLKGYTMPDLKPYLLQSITKENRSHTILPMLGYEDARTQFAREKEVVFTVAGYGYGIFESAWMMRGYMDFFSDLLENPSFCHELLDALTDRHLALLDELVKLPCDGIIFSDDYGDQRGVIIGKPLWQEFVKPCVAKLYERVHAGGKMVFQHTCGNVFDIIPDLMEIGLDVLQSLQPEAMPVYEIKRLYGKELRLWGGLGTQHLLPRGTPEDVQNETRRLIREMGKGGGYCFTSSKPIMEEVPVQNAVALIDELISLGA